jgi:hypothetical protein
MRDGHVLKGLGENRLARGRPVKDCRDLPNRGRILEFGGAADPPRMILDRPCGSEPAITCNLK